MQVAFQIALYVIGLSLMIAVIAAMMRGSVRRYPFVFLYVVTDFLTTALEIRPGLTYQHASPEALRSFARLYWWDERILQAFVFVMVISLVYGAAAYFRARRALIVGIVVATLAFAGITFLIHFDPDPSALIGKWMTPWTRDLNFCAAVLDLGLWALLLGKRDKDYCLMMISGALGIQFTGDAIFQSLRDLSPTIREIVRYAVPFPNFVCLYIWWQAFRSVKEVSRGPSSDEAVQRAAAAKGRSS
jgi:hypothetical protein